MCTNTVNCVGIGHDPVRFSRLPMGATKSEIPSVSFCISQLIRIKINNFKRAALHSTM